MSLRCYLTGRRFRASILDFFFRNRPAGEGAVWFAAAFLGWHATALQAQQVISPELSGATLQAHLQATYRPVSVYSYDVARDTMYLRIDNRQDSVVCVYTGFTIGLRRSDGDPSTVAANRGINAEHTWPQSMYNSASPMVSDLHQLFPSWDIANSTRNNHPFAEIDDNLTATWLFRGTTSATAPPMGVRPLYAEYYNSTFEPRESQKGNTARAIFYMWAVYQNDAALRNDETDNEAFFNGMKSTLLAWHYADPADADEAARNDAIFARQGNRNPFILDSTLARRTFFAASSTVNAAADTVTTRQVIISQYYEGDSNDKFVEVTNAGRYGIDFSKTTLYLCLFANPSGSVASSTPASNVKLSGYLAPGASVVYKHSFATKPAAALTVGINSSVANYNGNDPLILSTMNNNTAWNNRTDVFGLTDGSNFALNIAAHRNAAVVQANRTYTPSEWTFTAFAGINNATAPATEAAGTHVAGWSTLAGGTEGWRLLFSPAAPSELLRYIWTQANPAHIYRFDTGSQSYQALAGSNDPAGNGQALAVFVFADDNYDGAADPFPKVLPGQGLLANGTYLYALPAASGRWAMVGNPFRSPLNWDSMARSGLSSSVVLWNHRTTQFMYWNGVAGTGGMTSGTLPAGQAFFVRTTASNASLTADDQDFATGRPGLMKDTPVQLVRIAAREADVLLASAGDPAYWMPPLAPGSTGLFLTEGGRQDRYAIFTRPDLAAAGDLTLTVQTGGDAIEPQVIQNTTGRTVRLERVPGKQPALDTGLPRLPGTAGTVERTWKIRFEATPTANSGLARPAGFRLSAYPNPFNPHTTLQLELPEAAAVTLTVYDLLGRKAAEWKPGVQPAGSHAFSLDGSRLSSGTYLVRAVAGRNVAMQRITLLK